MILKETILSAFTERGTLSKETILSAFTERGTLLKWLKKVEAALNNAVLADVSIEKISTTQIKLKFTFENGDFVESPVITLPRGDTGASGVGFDDVAEISINDGAINITAGDDGVNIDSSFEVAVGEEILEIPSSMYLPFKGSESIIIDVDESGDFIDIHLDADIANKIGRALVTPMSAPSALSLVGVNASNAQTMIKIGDGLVIENGVLKLARATSPTTIPAGTYRWKENVNFTNINYISAPIFDILIPSRTVQDEDSEVEISVDKNYNGISVISNPSDLWSYEAPFIVFTSTDTPPPNMIVDGSVTTALAGLPVFNAGVFVDELTVGGLGRTFTINNDVVLSGAEYGSIPDADFVTWFKASTDEVI